VLGLVAVTVYQQDWLRAQDLLGRYEALAPITAQSAVLGQQIFQALGEAAKAGEYARRAEDLSASRSQPARSGRSEGGSLGY
jgi:Tfp pilus assembly protein PilF